MSERNTKLEVDKAPFIVQAFRSKKTFHVNLHTGLRHPQNKLIKLLPFGS